MADQGTAARLIEVATAEIGVIEGPKITKQSMALTQRLTSNLGAEVSLTGVQTKPG
jgi:hypothetical protein